MATAVDAGARCDSESGGHDRPSQPRARRPATPRDSGSTASRRAVIGVRLLQLRPQEGGDQLAGQKRRADVHPRVLVDLAAEELRRFVPFSRMISARSTNRCVVDDQRAAFAGDDVLRLVEAEAPPGAPTPPSGRPL